MEQFRCVKLRTAEEAFQIRGEMLLRTKLLPSVKWFGLLDPDVPKTYWFALGTASMVRPGCLMSFWNDMAIRGF